MDHKEPVSLINPLAEATTGLAMRTSRVTDVTLHSWGAAKIPAPLPL